MTKLNHYLVQVSRDYLNELMENGVDMEVSFGGANSIKFVPDGDRRFNMIVGEEKYIFACENAVDVAALLSHTKMNSVSILSDGQLIIEIEGNLFSLNCTFSRK